MQDLYEENKTLMKEIKKTKKKDRVPRLKDSILSRC